MPTHTFGEQLSSVSGCFRGYAMQNSWTLWLHCMSGVSIKLCWLVLDLDWPIQEYHGHHEHEDQAGINGEGEEKYEHREETRIAGRLGLRCSIYLALRRSEINLWSMKEAGKRDKESFFAKPAATDCKFNNLPKGG